MPEALKVHSGERVDLVDYVHGANAYTQASEKFAFERMWLDRRARIIEGFRIRVEDQTTSPGMITVFNGNALNREGQLVNNEQVTNDSRSVTLLGAGLTFYVEIEFIENASNTDARFFWDPTSPNTPPEPSGSEFPLNVATRLTPDWRVVTPVSTTGFEQSTNPNSTRIPLAVFATDGSNRISTGASNPGLALVRAASILEEDVSASDTELRVIDARMFPATLPFDITVDLGSGSPEARTVTALDRVNGICTVSVPLTNAHRAGAIIQVTSGSADLVREKLDPSDPALDSLLATPGHPDHAQRFWQANEVRGSGLISSKNAYGTRDDLNVRSLKDHIDYLSAQLRELKFGSPRPETVNTAPPSSFSARPRYFDPAGSVQGARSNTVSIGNGSTSFGDFNGTDGVAVFSAALNALPTAGGTIFVKAGTYNFASAVTVSKNVRIVGEGQDSTVLNVTNAAGPGFTLIADGSFENLTLQQDSSAPRVIDVTALAMLSFNRVLVTGQIRSSASACVRAWGSGFVVGSGVSSIFATTGAGQFIDSEFVSCSFTASSKTVFSGTMNGVVIDGGIISARYAVSLSGSNSLRDVTFRSCKLLVEYSAVTVNSTGVVDGLRAVGCRITVSNIQSVGGVFYLISTGEISNVHVDSCVILVTGGSTVLGSPGYVLYLAGDAPSAGIRLDNVDVDVVSPSVYVAGIHISRQDSPNQFQAAGCTFFGASRMLTISASSATMTGVGSYKLVDCVHDNDSRHDQVVGVFLEGNPTFAGLELRNCAFINYDSTTGASLSRFGMFLDTNTTNPIMFVVDGCKFHSIGGGTTFTAVGIYFAPTVLSSVAHVFKMTNNEFVSVSSGNSGTSAGIYIAPSSTLAGTAQISNNIISSIGSLATSAFTAGIYLKDMSGSITGNMIRDVSGASTTEPTSGIYLSNTYDTTVQGNHVMSVAGGSGATLPYTGCGIRAFVDTAQNVQIIGNMVNQLVGGPGSRRRANIHIIGGGASFDTWSISNNMVSTSDTSMSGIRVDGSSNDAQITNGSITGNVIKMNSTASNSTGIHCTLGGRSNNINISNNSISDVGRTTTTKGIFVSGEDVLDETRNVSVSNNIIKGTKVGGLISSATYVGIWVQDIHNTTVSNNIIDWLEPGLSEGIAIRYVGVAGSPGPWSGHVCVGNVIRTDGTSAAGGAITIDSSAFLDGILGLNNIRPASPIPINPAVAGGGWVYETNLT